MVSASPKGKSLRRSAAKVKSGCKTWDVQREREKDKKRLKAQRQHENTLANIFHSKARHIKCDETKPSCLECLKTGRKCDGYLCNIRFHNTDVQSHGARVRPEATSVAPGIIPRTASTVAPKVSYAPGSSANHLGLQTLELSNEEHRSFSFFLYETAPALSSWFDESFWGFSIPRAAVALEPVRHALIAVAALHEYTLKSEWCPDHESLKLSLTQYNKSIKSLNISLTAGDSSCQLTVLLTCILFVIFEFMRGTTEHALNHLQSGLKIVVAPPRRAGWTADSEASGINQELTKIFSRLSIQALLVGSPPPQEIHGILSRESSAPKCPHSSFSSLREARDELNKLFVSCLTAVDRRPQLARNSGPEYSEVARRRILDQGLKHWTSQMALFTADNRGTIESAGLCSIRVLRVQSIIATIWNNTTLSGQEITYDAHVDSFKTLVDLAPLIDLQQQRMPAGVTPRLSTSATGPTLSSMLTPSSISPKPTAFNFTLESGLIFPLFFTAIKCRSPSIRRQAIHVLQNITPRREAMWDAQLQSAIALRLVELEEDEYAEAATEGIERWPCESMRVGGYELIPGHDLEGMSVNRVQQVRFYRKFDVGGERRWADWVENIAF